MATQARYEDATTSTFSGTLRVESADPTLLGDPIPLASITEFYLKLTDGRSGTVVNGRTGTTNLIGNLSAANLTIHSTSGALAWAIQALDTTRIDVTQDVEEHIAEFRWVYSAFSSNNAGVGEAIHRLVCEKSLPFMLCTFEDVASIRGLSETDRLMVESLIRAFTARAELETVRSFQKSTVGNPTTEVISVIGGQRSLQLKRYPIDSVISVKQNLDGDFTSAQAFDPADLAIKSDIGIVRLKLSWFFPGDCSVEVKYAGGLALETAGVPADLRMAAARQVAYWHSRLSSLGVLSESVNGMSVNTYTRDLLDDVAATLSMYETINL